MSRIRKIVVCFLCPLTLAVAEAGAQDCVEREPTRQTGPGPHDFTAGVPDSKLWREGDEGEPLFFRARILDMCSAPVVGARIRIVHANASGGHEFDRWRAELTSDEQGVFNLVTVFPGYTGGIPRHIHFVIDHPEHGELVTRLFFRNDPAIDHGIEDLAMVLDEVERDDGSRAWLASYEFVLPSR